MLGIVSLQAKSNSPQVLAECGKRSLFPLWFHCTGMPIKACADKLAAEIELFGTNFERYEEEEEINDEIAKKVGAPAPTKDTREEVTKFVSKKSKAIGKTVKMKFQFQIMRALDVPKEASNISPIRLIGYNTSLRSAYVI